MLLKLAISVAGSLGVYALYEVLKLAYGELKSPIRYLPGPPSTHWFYGNLKEIFKAVIMLNPTWSLVLTSEIQENSVLHEQWVQQYGPTIKYKVFLGVTNLKGIRLYAHFSSDDPPIHYRYYRCEPLLDE
jgi:hypothetical protein